VGCTTSAQLTLAALSAASLGCHLQLVFLNLFESEELLTLQLIQFTLMQQ